MLSVVTLSFFMLCVIILRVVMVSVDTPSFTISPLCRVLLFCVFVLLSVIILGVVMLSVVIVS